MDHLRYLRKPCQEAKVELLTLGRVGKVRYLSLVKMILRIACAHALGGLGVIALTKMLDFTLLRCLERCRRRRGHYVQLSQDERV